MTQSGMSPSSMPTLLVPTLSGLARSSIFVIGPFTSLVLTPIPVIPDCHAMPCVLPGSKKGSLAQLAAFASKFGRFDGSSS